MAVSRREDSGKGYFRMRFWRAVMISALLGAAVPVAWYAIHATVGHRWPDVLDTMHCDVVLMVVWPSSVLLIADPLGENLDVQVMAVLGNVLLYAIVGALVWLGVLRSRWMLATPVAVLAVVWWWVFSTFW
mgnify:CR=1 FL=1